MTIEEEFLEKLLEENVPCKGCDKTFTKKDIHETYCQHCISRMMQAMQFVNEKFGRVLDDPNV